MRVPYEGLRGTSRKKGPKSRRWVLKAVYARRQAEMDEARAGLRSYPTAVYNYIEARNAWRKIRGWQ